jgi:hypothetical protein
MFHLRNIRMISSPDLFAPLNFHGRLIVRFCYCTMFVLTGMDKRRR